MDAPSAYDIAEAKRNLDAFLVDNQELEILNARLGVFNLFRVLRAERVEIRHSNVLAWLLTPGDTHGLGDAFLRRFLSRLLLENEGVDVRLTPAQVELMKFEDVEVLREWHNIDILVKSSREQWCLLIENKIHSKERKGALSRYKAAILKETPELEVIPVFLTLEGNDPSEEGREAGYVSLSHVQVLELAESIISHNKSRIPEDAAVFLDHYLTTLRRLTMQDQELVDLCKQIYRKHREAIDLIVEYGTSSEVMDACEDTVKKLVPCDYVVRARGNVWFVPAEMATQMPEVPMNGWKFLPKGLPVAGWVQFRKNKGRLRVVLEVGPIADGDQRVALLKELQSAGFSFSGRALRKEAKFTRLLSKSQKLETDEKGQVRDDAEYIAGIVESLWRKLWGEGEAICGVLKAFDWKKSK